MQDLERQLAALEEFRSFLMNFREEIGDKLIAFSNKSLSLRENGVAVQIADYYLSNFCEPNTAVLHNLKENIAERDLPYINENIAKTIELLGIR
jgi:hypothetical protein